MSVCPQCQNTVPDGIKFCPQCGVSLVQMNQGAGDVLPPSAVGSKVDMAGKPTSDPSLTARTVPGVPQRPTQPVEAPATAPGMYTQPMNASMPPAGAPVPPAGAPVPPSGAANQPAIAPTQVMEQPVAPTRNPVSGEGASVPPAQVPPASGNPAGQTMPTPVPEGKPKSKRLPIIIAAIAIIAVIGGFAGYNAYQGQQRSNLYDEAVALMNQGDYSGALEDFQALGDYQDAPEQARACEQELAYEDAMRLMGAGDFEAALEAFQSLGDYKDASEQIKTCEQEIAYADAMSLYEQGDYAAALEAFEAMGDYKDASQQAKACTQEISYAEAMSLYDGGDYEAAREAFEALGGFRDASEKADSCNQWIAYQKADQLYADGDYAAARDAFNELAGFQDSSDKAAVCNGWAMFQEVSALTDEGKYEEAAQRSTDFYSVDEVMHSDEYAEWSKRNEYGMAENLLANGEYLNAYNLFGRLGDYSDAAARMEECVQPYPETGELYHNENYISSSNDVVFDATGSEIPIYLKLYDGDTSVSNVFINPGGSVTIQVPSGNYTVKEATGDKWFGNDLFGDTGHYQVMVFDDGSTVQHLDDNLIWTLTLQYSGSDGNVGTQSTDYDTF